MKGKWAPGKMNPLDPSTMASRVYTDVHDQDWNVTMGEAGNLVARPGADAANYYSKPTSYAAASAPDYDNVADAVDAWVDQWSAGQNPQPQMVQPVDAAKPTKGGGAGVLGLIILAILVLSDKKR